MHIEDKILRECVELGLTLTDKFELYYGPRKAGDCRNYVEVLMFLKGWRACHDTGLLA